MRRLCALFTAAAFLAGASSPPGTAEILRAMEELAETQSKAGPSEARALEGRLAAYGDPVRKLGTQAVDPLSRYAAQRDRPLKVRLYAAAFLGLLQDPGALGSLKGLALDAKEDPGLRAVALQNIASLRIDSGKLRPIFDEAASLPSPPEAVLRETLAQLAWIGTDAVAAVALAAKKGGPSPSGTAQGNAAHALEALGRSPSPAATPAIFELLRYFTKGSPVRSSALAALELRGLRPRDLRQDDLAQIAQVAQEEEGSNAVNAARLLGSLADRRAAQLLIPALKSPDPAVVAQTAESLARLGDRAAQEPLARLAAGLLSDPRFEPRPGRPDTGPLAVRIEKALDVFRFQVQPQGDPASPFRYEGWPGRGKPRFAWKGGGGTALNLRASPDAQSREAASLDLGPGAPLRYDASLVFSRAPGRARALRDAALEARELGAVAYVTRAAYEGPAVRRTLYFKPGDALEILAYLAGSSCFVRKDGTVFEASCPQDDRRNFALIESPRTEWWLHLKSPEGSGWFPAQAQGVELLGR